MEAVVFEIIMGIFFDAGMLAMVVHAAQHIGEIPVAFALRRLYLRLAFSLG